MQFQNSACNFDDDDDDDDWLLVVLPTNNVWRCEERGGGLLLGDVEPLWGPIRIIAEWSVPGHFAAEILAEMCSGKFRVAFPSKRCAAERARVCRFSAFASKKNRITKNGAAYSGVQWRHKYLFF